MGLVNSFGVALIGWSLALINASGGLYYYAGLAVLVAMMIWGAILAHAAWEEAHEDLDPASPEELLDAFEQARAEGELDETEFARVRHRIEEKERPE